MKLLSRSVGTALRLAAFLALTAAPCLAAATLTQQIDPPEVKVGDPVIVTLTVQGGSIGGIQLPPVDGLEVNGTSFQIKSEEDNGNFTTSVALNISLVATRPGNFTIPAFDLHTQEGDVLHVKAMKLHVLGGGSALPGNTAAPAVPVPAPFSIPSANLPFNPQGPVVMPPNSSTAPNAAEDSSNTTTANPVNPPVESDGRPAKVFMVITPETTDAYVGQSIPLRVDWYIRRDVDWQQNSLPTIKGSDFLMNDLSYRPRNEEQIVMNEEYRCEGWTTAISAPKSGDFPLSMERDSYWIKSITTSGFGFFGMFDRHANLDHQPIPSNQLTIHVHALPTEGRPAHFTGVIGQLKVTGEAQPGSVAVGEPVTLSFTVSGQGNFDYVRCPALPDDPAWKTYVPSSKTDYLDESHTHAVKTFQQSVIPQKNGKVPLPTASFSYFDPAAKQYVTVPVALPEITVTGSPIPLASASPAGAGTDSTAAPATPATVGFLPNRLEIGSPRMSLAPVYRQPWFWAVQGGFVSLPLLGALFFLLRSRSTPDDDRAERAQRRRSLQQEEDAMAEAVRRADALAFFMAARHAIQLQLARQWNLRPEALTLGEIRSRDPQLAETLEPLFAQADEVIYSGQASPGLDLAQWERHVRELLQPQPQPA